MQKKRIYMKNFLWIAIFSLTANFSSAMDKNSAEPQVIQIQVTENGFEPNQIDVTTDVPVVLNVTRKTNNTCATEIEMKSQKLKKALPLNETIRIDLGKLKKGKHNFSCGMDMFSGTIQAK